MNSTLQSSMASSLYDVRLRILKRMAGAGGVGQVYKAVYGGTEAVAKIPFVPEHERLVYEESRVMSALNHSNVVQSLAFMSDAMISIPGKEEARRTALLVEFMNLGTFSTYCKERSQVRDNGDYSLVKSQTLDMFTQAVRGIEYMHKKEYCHLDLKPDNILIHKEKNGTLIAKVSDMGSTVKIGTEASVFQTKGFFPPESRLSRVKTDKFDIYALGAIIINIITQTPLTNYWGDTKTWEAKRSFLAQYIRNQDLLKMVMACIHDNPDERPTATEMLHQLSKLQQHDFDPVVLRIEESR
ncbi:Interferon-induced, double-stranded RNA-activated protein kinase, partial [Globomyces sp. JEL0801]